MDHAFRIAIPLAGFNLSGGVKSLIGLANALAARHQNVRFLVPDYASTPPAPLRPDVQVRVLRSGPSWLPTRFRKAVYLARLATTATAGADVCLANYFTTAYAAWLSHTLRGDHARLAYNVRGYEPVSHGLLARASLTSRLVRYALAWFSYRLPLPKICTTDWLRDRIGDSHAFVVGHGIDLGVFRPPSAKPRRPYVVIGAIGRLGDVKGYPDFLRAVALLPPALPIRLALATPDPVPLPSSFAVEVSQPKDEPAMAAFFGECDVFVFPSRAEGFGLPALEAMARGCAVLTTDCGGIRAFARPGENCLMVAPADPPSLADALARLIQDAGLRVRLAAAGVETARAFGQDVVLERFCAYLIQLAGGGADRRDARSSEARGRPFGPASPGSAERAR